MPQLDNETAQLLKYYREKAEAYEKALIKIAEIVPEDCFDWQVYGAHSSDRYMRINHIIVSEFAPKRIA